MPEDMAPQPPVSPAAAASEAGQPLLTPDQVMAGARAAAENIVDAALATPEGQAAQIAAASVSEAGVSSSSSQAGLSAVANRAGGPGVQPNFSEAMASYRAGQPAAAEAPAAGPNMITGVPSELDNTVPAVGAVTEKTPAQIASEISAAAEQVGLSPTAPVTEATTAKAPLGSRSNPVVMPSSSQAGLQAIKFRVGGAGITPTANNTGEARTSETTESPVATPWPAPEAGVVAANLPAPEGDQTPSGQQPTSEVKVGNPALDAILTEVYGDPENMSAEVQPTTTEAGATAPDMTPTTTAPAYTEATRVPTTTGPTVETTVPPVTTTTEVPTSTLPSTTLPPSIPPTA